MSSTNFRISSAVDKTVSARRKKETISPVVTLKSTRLLRDMGAQEEAPKFILSLKECIETDNSLRQVNLIKQIGLSLQKNRSTHCDYENLCIKIFVEMYLQAENRHITKRTIASTLQTLPIHHHYKVIECLRQSLQEDILLALSKKNVDVLRHVVDNVMSCMENFNLGTQSISDLEISVLRFINIALETFINHLKGATCPTVAMKASLNCQTTVRTLILILQKCPKLKSSRKKFNESDSNVKEMLPQLIDNIIQLLVNEENSLDCRCNCGMVLPLLHPLNKGQNYMQMITLLIFSNNRSLPPTIKERSCLISNFSLDVLNLATSTSKLCLAIGFLSTLETEELLLELDTEITLFIDVLLPHIMAASKQANESSITVITSRAVLMWTKRAKEALQEMPDNQLLTENLKGEGDIACQLLGYVWTHWEHFIDSVRHTTIDIFDNVIMLHILSSKENPTRSSFIVWLVESLLKMPWHKKGKYKALCCLVDHFGATQMLDLQPNLPGELLKAMGEQALLSHGSELMETLFSAHKMEVNKTLDEWEAIWVMPVINAISEKSSNTSHLEHLLSKLLTCSPASLNFIISELVAMEASSTVGHLRALIITAKTARTLGLIGISNTTSSDELTWNDIFPTEILQLALCHVDDEIRLDAFALLCDTQKTSEILPSWDLDLIRAFLPYNMNNQSPAFRQRLLALVKKLIIRINDGGQAMLRQLRQLRKKDPESDDLNSLQIKLATYKNFLEWLCYKQIESLHPGANFPRRGIALNILKLLHEIIGFQPNENELNLVEFMDQPNVQTLLEGLKDTYETNKIIALNILKDLSTDQLGFNEYARVSELFDCSLQLASRLRPTDCVTAAYLFRLLVCHPHTYMVAMTMRRVLEDSSAKTSQDTSEQTSPGYVDASSPNYNPSSANSTLISEAAFATLEVLTFQLMVELEMAKGSLLEAAANGPMYGVLFCIRSLLQDLDFRAIASSDPWVSYISVLIGICLEVGEVVGPVVNNASPEGYLPAETDADELTELQSQLQAVLGNDSKSKSVQAVSDQSPIQANRTLAVTAQMLLLCGWRTMKEISLILGDICQRSIEILGNVHDVQKIEVPNADKEIPSVIIQGNNADLNETQIYEFVSIDQVLQIGNYFITLLAETKHRGAFEQAYVGFCKVCDGLWRSPLVALHELPQQWLQELFELIQSGSGSSTFCSTRRSAGLPFMVQALVSSEPDLKGSSCFKQAMVNLLEMALSNDCAEEIKVHGFNILRALYRDTRLGDDVSPYIADGLQAAILGFRAKTWSVRNSATLLFSALITRIFGVKRSRDELSKKNCMTGTVFFQRFPSLYQFLLDELNETTKHVEENRFGINIQPSLYPILLILARLYPSSIEGTQSTIKLSSFVPYVRKCGQRPVMNTRILAAKALVPLVLREDLIQVIKMLLETLPDSLQEMFAFTQNAIHGALLQVFYLIRDIANQAFTPVEQDQFRGISSELLTLKIWIASSQNPCPMTRGAFLDIIDAMLSLEFMNSETHFYEEILEIVEREISQPNDEINQPGVEILQMTAAKLAIQINLLKCNSGSPGNYALHLGHLEKCIVRLLFHDRYEVRWAILRYLYNALALINCDHYKVDFRTMAEMGPSLDPSIPAKEWAFINRENSKEIARVMQSEEIMIILLTKACSTEQHSDCLAQLYHLLTLLPKVIEMPWPSMTSEKGLLTCSEKMELILQKGECELRDDIRSALLHFTGFIIPHVYDEQKKAKTQMDWVTSVNPKLILSEFTEAFLLCCAPEQSVKVRLTATQLLIRNAHILLLDPEKCLGASCLSIWSAAVLLLRDDEPFIKTLASNVVEICSKEPRPRDNMTFDTAIQPALALDILIGQFVSHFGYENQSDCLTMLLDWMLHQDAQDNGFLFDEEERMFDRGQMNIYAEEINFTDIIQKHFKTLLQKIFQPNDQPTSHPNVRTDEIRTQAIANLGRRNSKGVFRCLPQSSTLEAVTFQGMADTFKGIMGSFKVTSDQVTNWLSDTQKDDLYTGSGHVYLQDVIDMVVEEMVIVLTDAEAITHQTPFLNCGYDQTIIRLYRLATAVYCLCKYDKGQTSNMLQIQSMMDRVFGRVEFRNWLVSSFVQDVHKLCTFHSENSKIA